VVLLSADLAASPWVTAAPGSPITADLSTAHSINVLCKHISSEQKSKIDQSK